MFVVAMVLLSKDECHMMHVTLHLFHVSGRDKGVITKGVFS